jgi:hypothetical protein
VPLDEHRGTPMKIFSVNATPVVRQENVLLPATKSEEGTAQPGCKVSLSDEALNDARNKDEVRALHARIYGTPSLGDRISYSYRTRGEEKFKNEPPPENYTPEQAERHRQALDYLVGIEKLSGVETQFEENPFWGLDRAHLVAIEQDENSYTEVERYAAARAKTALDNIFFTRLSDHAYNTGDLRPVFKGYLEYLDNLTDVERLNFPADERERVAGLLARAQSESGSLPEGFSLWQYMNWAPEGRLDLEALLNPAP